MLLAVDIGNTSIKFAFFDDGRLISRMSLATSAAMFEEALRDTLGVHRTDVDTAIISSVVPDAESAVAGFVRTHCGTDPLLVRPDTDFALTIRYEPLASLGTDRLVNCFAAIERYDGPAIVCSFGTATTIDVVTGTREYLGGVIALGMRTSARALNQLTANLPDVEPERPGSVLGNTTADSIRSGVFLGHAAMVEGLLQRIEAELDERPRVIATGGLASLIAPEISRIDVVEADLTLEGLALLHARLV